MNGPRVDEAAVRAALDTVIDPCSRAAGAPAGLAELGLVPEVAVVPADGGHRVRVRLRLTDPTCVMGPAFLESAHEVLKALPGVGAVDVGFDEDSTGWTEEDMAPAYRRRLTLVRAARSGARAPSL